jgi:hypothetical protein
MTEVIRTFTDSSGSRRVDIIRRNDGTYTFEEFRFSAHPDEMSWIPTSSRYATVTDSPEGAEREAQARVDWLISGDREWIVEDLVPFLERALVDAGGREASIRSFQEAIWNGKVAADPETVSMLRDLAYDLDFFETDDAMRRQDPSFYGLERFEREVRAALKRLRPDQRERG